MGYEDEFAKLEERFDFLIANDIRKDSGVALKMGEITLEEWQAINDRVDELRSAYRKAESGEGLSSGTVVFLRKKDVDEP